MTSTFEASWLLTTLPGSDRLDRGDGANNGRLAMRPGETTILGKPGPSATSLDFGPGERLDTERSEM